MKVSRRRFLGFSAGAVAGAATGVPASRALSDLVAATEEPIYPPRGTEDFALSICQMCPGGCGLRVRRIDGRPVRVDGNPLHPVNGGRLCPRGQASLQSLLHPDRLRGPMRRVGPPGSLDSFEPATWEEALSEIGDRLRLLRQVERPESLVLIRRGSRGLGQRLARRFLQAFGSPNDIDLDRGDLAAALALEASQGVRSAPAFDVQSTDYVLSFGSALLEASSSPLHMMRAYGEFRQGRPGRRGKLVQIEPRLSITGSSADEWIRIRPGTEGILALGLARVLVVEGLYDKDFVSERTTGLEGSRDREGLRAFLESGFRLERLEAETGVSGSVILRVGREFAAARQRLAVGPRRGPSLPGTLFDHLAVQVLNALAGNLDAAGGVLIPDEAPLPTWPELPDDPVAIAGLAKPRIDGIKSELSDSAPEAFAEALTGDSMYPIEVLLLLDADPAFASMAPQRFGRALERVPLVVSFASLPNDSALLADWILPDSHFLERWELDTTPAGVPFPVVSLAQPATSTLGENRPVGEIVLALAREVGGSVADAFAWESLAEVARSQVEGLYRARRGTLMGTAFDEAWVRMMERAGWWAPGYRSAEDLWEGMLERGGWWDPFYDHGDWLRVLRTPSGRFEFRVDLLQQLLASRPASPQRTPLAPAGRESAEREVPDEPLLALYLFEPLPVAGGTGAELPFLQELLDPGHEMRWESWVEIHPETAENLRLHDWDRVKLISQHGSIEVLARVSTRVVPGVAAVPVGLGKKGGGRWAAGRGANPFRLLAPTRETISGLADHGATTVRLSLVSRGRHRRTLKRT